MAITTDNRRFVSETEELGDSDAPFAVLDARGFRLAAYHIACADEGATYQVFGAFDDEFTDEVAMADSATLAAGDSEMVFEASPSIFDYYRIKARNTSPTDVATVSIRGVAK